MGSGNPYTLFSLVFGLILGSFLNVCIHRIPRRESIVHPPSSCPHCGTRIRFYDNIPVVSFILLRGRCRSCRGPISARYPLVETITGLLSMALFARYGVSLPYFLWLAFCACLVVITFIDLDHKIIPDVLSIPGVILGFALSFLPVSSVSVFESILGILLGGGSLYLVAFLYSWIRGQEGMGGGDIKLLAMIGAWMGWKALPFVILISSLTGTLIGGGSLLLSRQRLSEQIPFGPFLALGALLYLFFQRDIYALWFAYLHLS
jgi:leader peptidase (prepilin peptidase)/N-methyltransferase